MKLIDISISDINNSRDIDIILVMEIYVSNNFFVEKRDFIKFSNDDEIWLRELALAECNKILEIHERHHLHKLMPIKN